MIDSWPSDYRTPGGDAYLLTSDGARKLLELVSRDGFGGDVDWRLLLYSFAPDEHRLLRKDSVAYGVLRNRERYGPTTLRSYCLFPCLVKTKRGTSVRSAEDFVVAGPLS